MHKNTHRHAWLLLSRHKPLSSLPWEDSTRGNVDRCMHTLLLPLSVHLSLLFRLIPLFFFLTTLKNRQLLVWVFFDKIHKRDRNILYGYVCIQPTIFHSNFSCTLGATECYPLSLGEVYTLLTWMSNVQCFFQLYHDHFYHCHQRRNQMDQPQHSAQFKMKKIQICLLLSADCCQADFYLLVFAKITNKTWITENSCDLKRLNLA